MSMPMPPTTGDVRMDEFLNSVYQTLSPSGSSASTIVSDGSKFVTDIGPLLGQQWGYFTAYRLSVASFGLLVSSVTTTSTSALGRGANGWYIEHGTTAVANNMASIDWPTSFIGTEFYPRFQVSFEIPTITNVRVAIGMGTGTSTVQNADNPGSPHVSLQYSTSRGDSNFQISHYNSSQTLVDTGVAMDTSQHHFVIDVISEQSVIVRLLDDQKRVQFEKIIISQIPSSGASFEPFLSARTLTGAARSMRTYFGSLVLRR